MAGPGARKGSQIYVGHQTPDPWYGDGQGDDIVCATGNGGERASHPGAGQGPKGRAVRPLKRYVSWVQTVKGGGPVWVTRREKPAHNGEALRPPDRATEGNPVGRWKVWMKPAGLTSQFLRWTQRVASYQALNYSKKRKYTAEDVQRFLGSKGFLPPP